MPSLSKDATSTAIRLSFQPIPRLHDDPDPDPVPAPTPTPPPAPVVPASPPPPAPAQVPTPEPDPDPDVDPPLGPKGEKALQAAKAAQRAAEADAKKARQDAAAALAKVQEFEDAKKSELERAQAVAERAQERAEKSDRRAVLADIRSRAVEAEFVDPSDGVDALAGDHKRFLTADGDVDGDAVKAALDEVLARKPHWKKQPAPAPVPVPDPVLDPKAGRQNPAPPKPDPSQGPRGGSPTPDYADREALAAEAAKFGLRTKRAPVRPTAR